MKSRNFYLLRFLKYRIIYIRYTTGICKLLMSTLYVFRVALAISNVIFYQTLEYTYLICIGLLKYKNVGYYLKSHILNIDLS